MSGAERPIASSSQTVGPFFHFALAADATLGRLAGPEAAGEPVQLRVHVLDGDGAPVPDALIEIYQADAEGRYPRPGAPADGFSGFGRLPTGADGGCTFETIRPGVVSGQAPHINVCLLARGLLRQLYTRIYLITDEDASQDPVLAAVPAERRGTLQAQRSPSDPGRWDFTIRLQGDGETVFFDL